MFKVSPKASKLFAIILSLLCCARVEMTPTDGIGARVGRIALETAMGAAALTVGTVAVAAVAGGLAGAGVAGAGAVATGATALLAAEAATAVAATSGAVSVVAHTAATAASGVATIASGVGLTGVAQAVAPVASTLAGVASGAATVSGGATSVPVSLLGGGSIVDMTHPFVVKGGIIHSGIHAGSAGVAGSHVASALSMAGPVVLGITTGAAIAGDIADMAGLEETGRVGVKILGGGAGAAAAVGAVYLGAAAAVAPIAIAATAGAAVGGFIAEKVGVEKAKGRVAGATGLAVGTAVALKLGAGAAVGGAATAAAGGAGAAATGALGAAGAAVAAAAVPIAIGAAALGAGGVVGLKTYKWYYSGTMFMDNQTGIAFLKRNKLDFSQINTTQKAQINWTLFSIYKHLSGQTDTSIDSEEFKEYDPRNAEKERLMKFSFMPLMKTAFNYADGEIYSAVYELEFPWGPNLLKTTEQRKLAAYEALYKVLKEKRASYFVHASNDYKEKKQKKEEWSSQGWSDYRKSFTETNTDTKEGSTHKINVPEYPALYPEYEFSRDSLGSPKIKIKMNWILFERFVDQILKDLGQNPESLEKVLYIYQWFMNGQKGNQYTEYQSGILTTIKNAFQYVAKTSVQNSIDLSILKQINKEYPNNSPDILQNMILDLELYGIRRNHSGTLTDQQKVNICKRLLEKAQGTQGTQGTQGVEGYISMYNKNKAKLEEEKKKITWTHNSQKSDDEKSAIKTVDLCKQQMTIAAGLIGKIFVEWLNYGLKEEVFLSNPGIKEVIPIIDKDQSSLIGESLGESSQYQYVEIASLISAYRKSQNKRCVPSLSMYYNDVTHFSSSSSSPAAIDTASAAPTTTSRPAAMAHTAPARMTTSFQPKAEDPASPQRLAARSSAPGSSAVPVVLPAARSAASPSIAPATIDPTKKPAGVLSLSAIKSAASSAASYLPGAGVASRVAGSAARTLGY